MQKIMKIKITQNPPPPHTHSTALHVLHKVTSILLLYRELSRSMPRSINGVRSGSSTSIQYVSVIVYTVTKHTEGRDYHDLLSHGGIMRGELGTYCKLSVMIHICIIRKGSS